MRNMVSSLLIVSLLHLRCNAVFYSSNKWWPFSRTFNNSSFCSQSTYSLMPKLLYVQYRFIEVVKTQNWAFLS